MPNIIDYLPPILAGISDYQVIGAAENAEIVTVNQAIEAILNNQFISTIDEDGATRWEAMLNIATKPSESLETRKFKISSRINGDLPYTYLKIAQQIDILCGSTGYEIELDIPNFTLIIRIALEVREQIDEVNRILDVQVPANIITDISLMYNTYSKLSDYTYGALSAYTNTELREEIIS